MRWGRYARSKTMTYYKLRLTPLDCFFLLFLKGWGGGLCQTKQNPVVPECLQFRTGSSLGCFSMLFVYKANGKRFVNLILINLEIDSLATIPRQLDF